MILWVGEQREQQEDITTLFWKRQRKIGKQHTHRKSVNRQFAPPQFASHPQGQCPYPQCNTSAGVQRFIPNPTELAPPPWPIGKEQLWRGAARSEREGCESGACLKFRILNDWGKGMPNLMVLMRWWIHQCPAEAYPTFEQKLSVDSWLNLQFLFWFGFSSLNI